MRRDQERAELAEKDPDRAMEEFDARLRRKHDEKEIHLTRDGSLNAGKSFGGYEGKSWARYDRAHVWAKVEPEGGASSSK